MRNLPAGCETLLTREIKETERVRMDYDTERNRDPGGQGP